ncbi:alpha/beta hydrolase family protein [Sphingosinicella rhizophila]|uniref:Alpha/beta fold hydrolase n=1 Tax=Sphingosinicella rhizophila TaxID=3050082 RepID=A0ABU3QAB7_9SPHN|nr:alpha/beta fold hydrolase [Sphingosinicella sp. GR2756]MDT9600267.1 alpha/beta fold hydrolase [Sphingosinicella sp. GR2756]
MLRTSGAIFLAAITFGLASCASQLAAASDRPSASVSAPGVTPGEETVFLMRQGADIVSAEWNSRTADASSGTIIVNESSPIAYTLDLGASGMVTKVAIEIAQPGSAPIRLVTPLQQSSKTAPQDAKEGVALYFDQAPVGMLEQLIRFARTQGTPVVTTKVYRWVDQKSIPATISFIGTDRARAEIGGKLFELVVDQTGRVLSGQLPDYGLTIERLGRFPRESYPDWEAYGSKPGARYTAEEVRIPAPEGHVLAGTLTMPLDRRDRVPAMILITGSSKSHRNASSSASSPSSPFRQIADALSNRGIAVLRLDDRGVGGSSGNWDIATTYDEAADIKTGLRYLRGRSDIDRKRIALLGWSEGSMIAPLIAAEDPDVAALVLMCAPATGRETVDYQIRYEVDRDPAIAREDREAQAAATLAKQYTSPRARAIIRLDSIPNARRVTVPVLLLQGTTDRQVPPFSASRLAAAFQSNGNKDVSVRLFPILNHLFLRDPDGRGRGYGFLPSMRVPTEVLDSLSDWASKRLSAKSDDAEGQ